jgi:hypothetical protein
MAAAPYAVHPQSDFEPQPGLPERLPAGEALLWQGRPDAMVLFRRACHGDLVVAWFALLIGWRFVAGLADGAAPLQALGAAAGLLAPAALAIGLLALFARLSARTTVYTLTTRRIVMRVGIVLTVSYNLPLARIDGAQRRGSDIALELEPGTRIAWAHLWPHVRPWRLRRPQPMLRGLPDADTAARLLAGAWAAANGGAVRATAGAAARPAAPAMAPRPRAAAQQPA